MWLNRPVLKDAQTILHVYFVYLFIYSLIYLPLFTYCFICLLDVTTQNSWPDPIFQGNALMSPTRSVQPMSTWRTAPERRVERRTVEVGESFLTYPLVVPHSYGNWMKVAH